MRTSIIIPALNEEESLGSVLELIPKNGIWEIIVVDGGSTDQTVSIAQKMGVQVIHETRAGYGRACAAGVSQSNGDVVVFLDADGADNPAYIPQLVTPIEDEGVDLVLGSRLNGNIAPGAMPIHQKFGNWLSAGLIRRIYNLQITDLSPFRAVVRDKLFTLNMQEMTYGWPTEMITKAARRGWRITEIPVDYSPRLGGKSKISGTFRGTILATFYILRTILRYSVSRKGV